MAEFNLLSVYLRKNPDGSVTGRTDSKLLVHWDKYRESKPDYRHTSVVLNCFRYRIVWECRK